MNRSFLPAVDARGQAGAPEREIEVTGPMIDAGAEVIERVLDHDPLMSPTFAVLLSEQVLRAAERTRRG
jgi:hypothetical protein